MFEVIISELDKSFKRKVPKASPDKVTYSRYRDLIIGIVLNLTCNVDNEEINNYLIKHKDILRLLKCILVDKRQDWPTNGAALALL
jgi:hypothetical protein